MILIHNIFIHIFNTIFFIVLSLLTRQSIFQVSIMLTYYAAQLGIALSAVGSKNSNNNNNNVSNDKTDTAFVKG